MPIERDGRHDCAPDLETPDGDGRFSCSCGKVWAYNPDERLWTPDTKRKTRTRKAGAE